MLTNDELRKVLVLGSGPAVIGQCGEFDYAGTQAVKTLKELGYVTVVVNPDPATMMTDPQTADITYLEPLDERVLAEIIERERPDTILPNVGGQTSLNLTLKLDHSGVLERYGVRVLGGGIETIRKCEDKILFQEKLKELDIELPQSEVAASIDEAERIASVLGYPVVIRPTYTLGEKGIGLVFNLEELRVVAGRGLSTSLSGKVLVEEALLGWEKYQLEVLRDARNSKKTACSIEYVDPVGVHTGDSICTVPILTLPAEIQEKLQAYIYQIADAIGIVGIVNVQFARDPDTGKVIVIEINPRYSRTSAWASKVTGLPIAQIATKLAAGLALNEITHGIDQALGSYLSSATHVAVRIPRWSFERFAGVKDRLSPQMKSIGEVMGIGGSFKEALQKAVRSLDSGRYGLGFARDYHTMEHDDLLGLLSEPSSERLFILYESLRKGAGLEELSQITRIKPWFIGQLKELVDLEESIRSYKGKDQPADILKRAKQDGFSDRYLAGILGRAESEVRQRCASLGIKRGYSSIHGEYIYSTYYSSERIGRGMGTKIMLLGGGPCRVGQGQEFEYCCVHGAAVLKAAGYGAIMVNCNPSGISMGPSMADRVYIEPITLEDVLRIWEEEKPKGIIIQLGGNTAYAVARDLEASGAKILGTSLETMRLAEDRERFRARIAMLGIPTPESGAASVLEKAVSIAHRIGYPIIIRPVDCLDGHGMQVVHDEEMLKECLHTTVMPVFMDKFLENAIIADVDALADGKDAYVPAVMEHVELAGVHSGDSACVIPPISISAKHIDTIYIYTRQIAKELNVIGLLNVEYAICNDMVYCLGASLRASRTIPLVSKVCNVPMVAIATEIILGKSLHDFELRLGSISHFGVKEAVFPFRQFPEVDPALGPEMRSTGQVVGVADAFGRAYYKALEAAGQRLPNQGTVLITVSRRERPAVLEVVRQFMNLEFKVKTTRGTNRFLMEHGIASEMVHKLHEGRPNIVDDIKNDVYGLIINTPSGKLSTHDDSYIRKSAIRYNIPYITTLSAAIAAERGIEAYRKGRGIMKSLQEYQKAL